MHTHSHSHSHAHSLTLPPSPQSKVIEDVQRSFVEQMKFPAGIALNEALCENVFMMLVSVLNQIPIFIIGKPGTSKSLAMELVQTNLQGKASGNDFLRSLPAVQKFSYQCSPLSTSQGIEQAFESARRYKMEAPNTIVVVLLDEVGLAEQSPHLPLKVGVVIGLLISMLCNCRQSSMPFCRLGDATCVCTKSIHLHILAHTQMYAGHTHAHTHTHTHTRTHTRTHARMDSCMTAPRRCSTRLWMRHARTSL